MGNDTTSQAPLRVVQVTLSNQAGTGGPAGSIAAQCHALARLGADVRICTVDWGPGFGESVPMDESLLAVHTVRGYVWPRPRAWLAPTFAGMLRRAAVGADLMHVQGFWLGIANSACKLARRMGIPYVISLRGQLAAPALATSAWKKAITRRLYADRNFRHAACLHATADHELADCRAFGLANPVAVIPNSLDITAYAGVDVAAARRRVADRWPETDGKKLILFLARVVPHKNPLALVRAWSRLAEKSPDWHLVIAGPDEMSHVADLQAAAAQAGVAARVTFAGGVYKQGKLDMVAACSLMVLPSDSENFGMSVAEALAAGKPAISTVTTPWQDLVAHRCGWLIELGEQPLAEALAEAMATDERSMAEMGQRGRRLIREKYSLEPVARRFLELYTWLVGRAGRPAFVNCDQETPSER